MKQKFKKSEKSEKSRCKFPENFSCILLKMSFIVIWKYYRNIIIICFNFNNLILVFQNNF